MQLDLEFLGPYRVESILGRGGMGVVYKGVHQRSGEPVAIKVISPAIADQMKFRRRFAAEVEVLKRLRHPNIVTLLGYGEERGLLFYAMEYVEGNSLEQHLRKHGRIPWEDVLEVGIQTTGALKHAHDLGIIHRDLKPANLLVASGGTVKLTDFGIAKLFGASEVTAAGAVIGTADYMPPEQAEGKPVTARSDLYALGCVMYALLAGKPPFAARSVPEVLYAVRYHSVPSLSEKAPEVPPELAQIVYELLEKDPSRRPPTALVVRNRLLAMKHATVGKKPSPSEKSGAPTGDACEAIGPEMTSLDLSDIDDDDLRVTEAAKSPPRTGETIAAPGKSAKFDAKVDSIGDDEVTVAAQDLQQLLPDGQSASETQSSVIDVDDFTHSPSVEASAAPGGHSAVTGTGPSRYHAVDDDQDEEPESFLWLEQERGTEPGRDWLHMASILGIVVLLLVAVGVIVKTLQPPTADELYAQVMQAVDSGDDGQLLDVRDEIEQFLARFPDDARAEELQALVNELELTRWTRSLRRRVSRGGEEALSALEQAFLDSMTAREENPLRAREKLAAFLDVFGQIDNLARDEQRLVELARYAQTTQRPISKEVPPAAVELEALIQSAEQSLSGAALKSFYRDILTLYADKPWAQPQIVRIRSFLESES
ncbi:MAG: serine/threonine protein kinase [Pirellulaceae bacterium]|nr:MAG: serine/threonine protein kinase [Pirellulaceae bacterium]